MGLRALEHTCCKVRTDYYPDVRTYDRFCDRKSCRTARVGFSMTVSAQTTQCCSGGAQSLESSTKRPNEQVKTFITFSLFAFQEKTNATVSSSILSTILPKPPMYKAPSFFATKMHIKRRGTTSLWVTMGISHCWRTKGT